LINFHLCPEGERLYDRWHKLSQAIDLIAACNVEPDVATVEAANAAWTTYQDHKNSCKNCGVVAIA
jgi:hypothetical protein